MVDDIPDTHEPQPSLPDRARRRRHVWLWLRAAALICAAPLVMALIAAILLIGTEVTAPSWVVRDVEERAQAVLAGGSLEFGEMTLTIGRDLHPRLGVRGAVLRDADGLILARVPRIDALLSPRGAIQGQVLAQEVELSGAQVSLRRAKNGTVALAFEEGAQAVQAADGFLALLDQVDQAFDRGALEALEQVRADGLIINFSDARAGRSWVVDDGRIALDLRDDALALRANVALLSGRAYVTTAEFSFDSARGSRRSQIGVRITDAAAADIASQSPQLAWLGVLDAPISGALRGEIDDDGALTRTSATLQIGAGELRPTAGVRPIPFQSARTYLSYDPAKEALIFDLVEVDSEFGRVSGTARAYLRDFEGGLPEVLMGQIDLDAVEIAQGVLYDVPLALSDARLDFRLRLNPFTLDIGQGVVVADGTPLRTSGQVRAGSDGWSVALDSVVARMTVDQLQALWPRFLTPRTRDWMVDNVRGGEVRDATMALRIAPGTPPRTALSLEMAGGTVRYSPTLPPIEDTHATISIIDRRVSIRLDRGQVRAPQGGQIDLQGSTMVIPRTGIPKPPARFELAMAGQMTAAMSVLALPPFNVLANSDLPVDFAQGRARIAATLDTPLGRDIPAQDRVWQASAQLSGVRSDALVPQRTLTSSSLDLRADRDSLTVSGPVRLDGQGGTMTFSRALGAGSEGTARIEADIAIGPAFLDTFNIALPPGTLRGEGRARLNLDLTDPATPGFRLSSDLRGIGLSLAALGWSKSPSAEGSLVVAGQLGATPRIDELSIRAPGLQTTGRITLADGGGLSRAVFDDLRLGGWLNAPVVLVGRGAGRPVGVQVAGGTLDLRGAEFGGGGGDGAGGPIEVALDTLQITDRIWLSDFRGTFSTQGGFQGDFTGNVNGQAPVQGTVVPVDGRAAVRIATADAGAVLRATELLRGATSGQMQLTLVPTGGPGTYDGRVVGRDLRVRDAPALASLLDAVSVVGLLTQLDGQGLLFSDLDAQFRLTPTQLIVTQSSAFGPGLGLSLDGYYATDARTVDFQGVLSPIYIVNGIGSVLTRPGEGLFGFNFNLRGPVDNLSVMVNPLSALTPGMFRDIFRRPPPQVGQ